MRGVEEGQFKPKIGLNRPENRFKSGLKWRGLSRAEGYSFGPLISI